MNDLIKKSKLLLNKFYVVIAITFVFGYIIHGQIIFNKLIYHDEVGVLYGIYDSMKFGRWFIFFSQRLLLRIFDVTSTNSFSVFFAFLFISLSDLLLLDMFEIRSKLFTVLFCLISITNLAVCSSFGYMFISIYLSFMIFTTSLSAYIIINCNHYKFFILAACIFACSIGTNQAASVLFVNIFLFYYIVNIRSFNIKKIIIPILVFAFGLFVYIFIYKIYYYCKDIPTSDYKNISTLGFTSFKDYFIRIVDAYRFFLFPTKKDTFCMYPNNCQYLYQIFLYSFIAVLVYYFIKNKTDVFYKVSLLIFLISTPLIVNAMFVIVGAMYVYALNLYNYVLVFLLTFSLFEKYDFKLFNLKFKYLFVFLTIFIVVSLFKYIDVCYTNLFFKTQQEQSFGLTLISRIENLDGYSDDLKICFIENPNPYFHKNDKNFSKNVPFDDIVCTAPYGYMMDGETTVYNNYQFNAFNRVINGFNPNRIQYNELSFKQKNESYSMAVYPKSGSIKIVDDVIIVKFEKIEKN